LRLEVIGRDPDGPPLAGQSINGFAGFFEMAWREYDYRRGRSDAHAALQLILGTYEPEAPADQPTAGRPALEPRPGSKIPRPDDYNIDPSLWKAWSRFPEVSFTDLSSDDQDALTSRIVDRGKALLGLSGLTGWAFGLVVKGKIASLLSGKEK
jgi:hypothetical protein